ncbi:hypothetical protein Tco_1079200 [Tanacetum coccineum]|uniref:Uncharacterized protein n=1 Tax=Tanacetum coccineum TaxID=301880 RepID=A0ABQ5HR75_9ASTR
MGDENPIRTLGDYSKPSHEGYRNTIELPAGNNVDLALYENKSWNDPRDFAKPIKAIALPQDVQSTSDRRLIELENQWSPRHSVLHGRSRTSLVEYAFSRTDEAEQKDIAVVGNLGYNKDYEGIEWLDVKEPLDLVETSEESVYESLIKEMPKCLLNYDFRIKKGDPRNLKIPCMIDGTKEITFKTSYKDPERSKLSSEGHDLLSSRVILSEDDYDRGCRKPSDLKDRFYRDTVKLGPECVNGMDDEGEVTLYLMRRSLEVLRKFHLTTLGGRFNQLLHVSSLLLSNQESTTFGRHLEKIHVTLAHLEKKRTRLQTNTKTLQDLKSQRLETAVTIYTRCRHTSSSDGVTTFLDGVSPHRLNSDLEDSTL